MKSTPLCLRPYVYLSKKRLNVDLVDYVGSDVPNQRSKWYQVKWNKKYITKCGLYTRRRRHTKTHVISYSGVRYFYTPWGTFAQFRIETLCNGSAPWFSLEVRRLDSVTGLIVTGAGPGDGDETRGFWFPIPQIYERVITSEPLKDLCKHCEADLIRTGMIRKLTSEF